MTTFSLITTILALVIFVGFVAFGVIKFGWQKSYSAFAPKWTEAVPIDNHTHLWSIVTIVVAILLAFGMIEQGEGHPLQFLGFFAPIYLIIVGFTPEYQTVKKQRIIHIVGTILCAICAIVWTYLAAPAAVLIVPFIAAWIAGIVTKTIERSLIFWSEMGMFAAVFAARLIGG